MIKRGEITLEKSKNPTSRWKNLLRVFDAKKEDYKPQKIAEIIFPDTENEDPDYKGSKKVRDYFDDANELIEGGYRKILLR